MKTSRSCPPAVELLEKRIAPASAAVIDLSTLNGASGFAVEGSEPFDSAGEYMRPIGDINGDGKIDFAVGADEFNDDASREGKVAVIFGSADGSYLARYRFDELDGTNGFVVNGEAAFDFFGDEATGADINGDGFSDLIVGAVGVNNGAGAVYVLFGHAGPFAAQVAASSINGTNGFRVDGAAADDALGRVGNPGDINGDGVQDVIMGAVGADNSGDASGSIYVLFGHTGAFTTPVSLSSLNGTTGFRVDGAFSTDRFGDQLSSGLDFNNDGVDDIAVGAPGLQDGVQGAAYVIYGHTGTFAATKVISSLNGTDGVRLSTTLDERLGRDVRAAGDLNGDGIDDLIIGTRIFSEAGRAYVVFGKTGGFGASLDVGTLNGSNGFLITGEKKGDGAGSRVTGVGDINGDGIDDIAIGSSLFDFNRSASGAAYVVFGRSGGVYPAEISLANLQLGEGFRIYGEQKGDRVGFDLSGVGDLNGDGFDDLLVGAAEAKRGGMKQTGVGYAVFGFDSRIIAGKNGVSVMDTDGDMISLGLKGASLVPQDIKINADGTINSIDISRLQTPGADAAKGGKLLSFLLKVKTPKHSDGDGRTAVGKFEATGVKLGKILLQADVGQIMVGGDDHATKSVTVSGNLGTVGGPASEFHGVVKKLKVGGDIVGSDILADRIGKGIIDGAIKGSTLLTAGLTGSLKVLKGLTDATIKLGAKTDALVVLGDVTNSFVGAKDSLAILQVKGDVVDSTISALGAIDAGSQKKSMAFKKAEFKGDFVRSHLLAGYDQAGAAMNADAGIGSVSIRGRFEGSDIVAGATAGANGFFGDFDDQLIPGGTDVVAMIGTVKISGDVLGSVTAGDHFGIVAEQIGKLQVAGARQSVVRGPGNDDSIPLGDTTDVKAREVSSPPI